MSKDKEAKEIETYSKMVNNNAILLNLEGWIKYIEGFTKGIESTDKVNSVVVLDCIGEILEYMTSFRKKLMALVIHCEEILQENDRLKKEIATKNLPIKMEETENGE